MSFIPVWNRKNSKKEFIAGLLGNLATSLWFAPSLAKWLHRVRGVRIIDQNSLFLGRGVVIDNKYPELITIGKDVVITYGVVILAHSDVTQAQANIFGMSEAVESVIIEDGVFIGSCSILLPGVRIGASSYVAAGSIVTSDVPSGVLVGGNPAKIIKQLQDKRNNEIR